MNEEIKEISESIYLAWKRDQKNKTCSLTLKQLNYFIYRLIDIIKAGLKHAGSDFDHDRYVKVVIINNSSS